MTDDLDDLRKALKAAPPATDPARRAEALAAAMQAFDRHHENRPQESADGARPMSDRPAGTGFLTGVLGMLANLTSRPALAATASIVALTVGLGVVLTQMPQKVTLPPVPEAPPEVTIANGAPAALDAEEPAAGAPKAAADAPASEAEAAATLAEPAARSDAPLAKTSQEADHAGASAMQAPSGPEARLRDEMAQAEALAQSNEAARGYAAPPAEALAGGLVAAAPSLSDGLRAAPGPDTEAFPEADPNPVKIVAEEPVSTFSIDVDTASYGVVRSSLMNGYLPPADAVRIEEMVNYFPYSYPAPEAGEAPFRPTVTVIQTPWNTGTKLVRIGVQGRMPAIADRPPLNLVFLIDTSGSMDEPNKLPLLKQSFRLMLGQLRPEDRVAIVTYAGSAGEVLEPTPASDSARILAALDNLMAGGSTAGQEGLQQAYAVAEGMRRDGAVSRIILATDGDFNVGISDPEELKDFIARKREGGTYLSVLGFGRGNLDDATMQALAQNGNGQAAYIDTLSEAQKVMVDQLTGALFPIADDVKIQMEFNPAVVAEYRLIGYETRALNREDFNNDKVDAGEIGAGISVTALYEVTPVGSAAVLSDPLRYGASEPAPRQAEGMPELGFLKLRYKEPGAAVSKLIETPVMPATVEADADTRFAAAIAGFGQLLTGAKYLGDWGWSDAIALANGARGEDPYGYRAEAVQLMRLAESLSL